MNRRGFLRMLGVAPVAGVAGVAATPEIAHTGTIKPDGALKLDGTIAADVGVEVRRMILRVNDRITSIEHMLDTVVRNHPARVLDEAVRDGKARGL